MKLIIASIVVLSGVVFFLFALFPADISVSRIINIHQSQQDIKKTISDLHSWRNWNLMVKEPLKTAKVQDSPVEMNVKDLVAENITVHLLKINGDTIFTKWQNGSNFFFSDFILTNLGNHVVLEWTMHFHLRWYPWEKLAGMFYDKQLGPQMEQSLLNLQKMSELPNSSN